MLKSSNRHERPGLVENFQFKWGQASPYGDFWMIDLQQTTEPELMAAGWMNVPPPPTHIPIEIGLLKLNGDNFPTVPIYSAGPVKKDLNGRASAEFFGWSIC